MKTKNAKNGKDPQLFMNYNTSQKTPNPKTTKKTPKPEVFWITTVEYIIHQNQFYFWVLRMGCFNFHTLNQTLQEL